VNKKSNNEIDFSIIIESTRGNNAQQMKFNLANIPVPPKSLSVWKTNQTEWFIREETVPVTGNQFTLNIQPQSIYTITTTSGQGKAKAPTMAASKPFPLPYTDNFNEYAEEATVKYFLDQGGSWTTRPDPTNPTNMVFTQVVTMKPILWYWCASNIDPLTVIGYNKYKDYSVSVNALLTEAKQGVYVAISGRIGPDSFDARRYGFPPGYTIQLESTGHWWVWLGTQKGQSTQLATGMVSFSINKWQNLEINFKGNNITVHFNGGQIWTGLDQTYPQGLAALGSGLHYAYFDNFKINGL
jgi:hypothetical protein